MAKAWTSKKLALELHNGIKNKRRYCFILGAGTSVESKIPMGMSMEFDWMNDLSRFPEQEILDGIEELREKGTPLEHDFSEIRDHFEVRRAGGKKSMDSAYYFDIFLLWQEVTRKSGIRYLEDRINGKMPSYGYTVLSRFLASGNGSNLVITTNFDSLTETALRYYEGEEAVIVNHESMASYANDQFTDHVMIAKIHNGLYYGAKNTPEETTGLSEGWKEALDDIFRTYIPIVIGYGGGDHSLMEYLKKASLRGLFWCYVGDQPDSEAIQNIVTKSRGHFVQINGFDSVLIAMGNEMYPELQPNTIGEALDKQNEAIKKNLFETYSNATLVKDDQPAAELNLRVNQEIDQRTNDGTATAYDYWMQATSLSHEGKHQQAIEAYTQAISLEPEHASYYYFRASSYSEIQEHQKAIADLDKAIALDENQPHYYFLRACSYDRLDRQAEAIDDFCKTISLQPLDSSNYFLRAVSYQKLNSHEKALSDLDKAIALDPQDAGFYYCRAVSYEALGQAEKAKVNRIMAHQLDPENY